MEVRCPICGRPLGKNERLIIVHDDIGSFMVEHEVPNVGNRTYETDDEWEQTLDLANNLDEEELEWIGWQGNCGLAGYTAISFRR